MSIKEVKYNQTGDELVTCYTGPRDQLISEGLATGDMLRGIGSFWRLYRIPHPEAGCWTSQLLDEGNDVWLLIRTTLLERVAA